MALVLRPAPPGVSYAEVLAHDSGATRVVNGLLGAAVGIAGYAILSTLVASVVFLIGWNASGAPGDLGAYATAGQAMEFPLGMLAAHLGVATLIPIAFGLVVGMHRVQGRWLNSVQPGVRWRYGLVCLLIAAVVLNLMLWASLGFRIGPMTPQPDAAWFLVVIVLTSPLQAAAEEYFFRGYLLQALTLIGRNRWVGVVASAVVFAVFHGFSQSPPLFAYRLGFGLLAGALVVLTGGLEAGIAAHIVNNLCSFTYAALGSSVAAAMATTEITWANLAWTLAAFAIFGTLAWLVGLKMRVATRTPA